ncbi:MAG: Eco57I restriction-modification methylase domain-containing protein, partial [Opitutales bacterium]|nr:Eco57I restriction-modification methylase domain-containing protein [Opitutales bacterium]
AESRAAVEFLVRNKQVGEGTPHGAYIRRNAARIESLLDTVKICDPAIGSGAFPIGLLQEIFWLKLTLDLTLNDSARLAEIKRRIIQNSIYGVDKDAGAVSIARLRFWLSLVVDEEAPQPLPNLDFKIMQGDSLLESFEGIPLDQFDPESMGAVCISPQAQLEMDFASSQLPLASDEKVNRITELMRAYFTEDAPAEKVRLHGEIDRFVLDHIEFNLNYRKDELETELHQHRVEIAEKQKQLASYEPTKKEAKRMEWLQSGIAEIERKKRLLSKLETEPERPYFLWHLFFQDVINQGGFDIVIANPPYVRQEVIKDYKPLLEAEGYDCYTGTADLFVYFYERSVKLLNQRGILTFITSNKYYRSGYGEKLREFLAQNLRIREMLDFGDAPVFDAIAYASILIGSKETAGPDHALKAWTWERGEKINLIARVMKDRAFPLDQANLTPDGWRLERPEVFALLNKLRSKGTPLGEYVKGRFYRGILTGLNEAFVVDRATRDRLVEEDPKSEEVLKPFLRGRDVKRWKATWDGWYLIKIESSQNKKHPWSGLPENEAESVFRKHLPAIHAWLNQHRDKLIKRDDQGTYFWELRSCVYWQEFEQPKVIYPNICRRNEFCWDEENYYANQKTFIIPNADSLTLCTLNSRVVFWLFPLLLSPLQNEFFEPSSIYMQHLPIPPAADEDKKRLSELVQSATTSTSRNDPHALESAESEINQIVYRLFDLTPEEIRLIESTLATESQTNPTTV